MWSTMYVAKWPPGVTLVSSYWLSFSDFLKCEISLCMSICMYSQRLHLKYAFISRRRCKIHVNIIYVSHHIFLCGTPVCIFWAPEKINVCTIKTSSWILHLSPPSCGSFNGLYLSRKHLFGRTCMISLTKSKSRCHDSRQNINTANPLTTWYPTKNTSQSHNL